MRSIYSISILCALCFLNLFCSDESIVVDTDPNLTRSGKYVLHRGEKFTGVMETYLEPVLVTRRTHYVNGLRDGVETETYQDGRTASERTYSRGRKEGIHKGWHENGKRRFHYEFKNDQFDGESWEWYSSGELYTFGKFKNGEAIGRKIWRRSGQIYLNQVYFHENSFGLTGSKICKKVKGAESDRRDAELSNL
ncbi:hypothetical protein EHQ53_10675 [Leptospira langatensis]|uniref:Membrane-binding protein n=1 Tax=Leptospira langatensis TaxID=2484983 RepID=A0A5F1ZRA6_9LEPT|nr:hypothetical protein [Leptospira langatensis]TGJ98975.1 hypothetical protein EHO57_15825 [Leptospira langatensis]TGL40457.1 hypothetical protein EHQ53_10675 [Leptospira langatensis]